MANYVGINNLSKRIAKGYVGVSEIVNILPSPTDMTYSGATVDGNGIVTYPATTGVSMVTCGLPTPIVGHIYYGRVAQKVPAGTSIPDGRFEYYQSDTAGTGLITFTHFSAATQDNEWHNYSARLSLSGLSSETGWGLRMFAVSNTNECYRKEPLIIDLTEHWGAGNEPSQNWCDANIPYFAGTYNAPASWGAIGKAKEIAKGYVGINNIAKLISFGMQETYFNSSLAPTSWNEVTVGTNYTAINQYGAWYISADSYNSDQYVNEGFDSNDSTLWSSSKTALLDTNCQIDCPILIKPTKIRIRYSYYGNNSYLQGYNTSTNQWDTLHNITNSSSIKTETVDISTNNYYSKFRITGSRRNASYGTRVYDFKVVEGYYK